MSFARIDVMGNLTRDAVVNQLSDGRNAVNFSVAVNKKFKNKEGVEVNKVAYFDCSYFVDKPTIAQYIKKGDQIYVSGEPEVKLFTTNEGRQNANISIRVQNINLLGGKKDDSGNGQQQSTTQQRQVNSDIPQEDNQDLPF